MDNNFESFKIRVSQWNWLGIFLIYLDYFRQLISEKKMLILVFGLSYGLCCWYLYLLFTELFGYIYLPMIISFLLGTFIFVAGGQAGANFYFSRYKIEYKVCIRDFLLQFFVSEIIAVSLLTLGHLQVIGAFITSNIILFLIYDNVLSKRKLPDMKVMTYLDADKDLDSSIIEESSRHEQRKVQIDDEARNCLVLNSNQKHLKVYAKDMDILSLGIGVKEYEKKPLRLQIKGYYSNNEYVELFLKEFDPRRYFRDRSWNDINLKLAKKPDGSQIEYVIFNLECSRKTNLYISFPITKKLKADTNRNNVYIIIVDSLRQDYFEPPNIMREKGFNNVAQLLENSVIYEKAYAQGTWTLPALGSIFSSLYSTRHGLHHPTAQHYISDEIPFLQEALRKNDYETYGFVTGPRTSPNCGYSRGFDRYYYRICDKEFNLGTADVAFEWVQEQERKSPYKDGKFFYIHLIDAHAPFLPRRDFEWMHNRISTTDVVRNIKKYKKMKQEITFTSEQLKLYKNLYKSELDFVMHRIELFLNYLKGRGTYEDSVIIIAGDHGINFTEHESLNTVGVYSENLHVGFSIKYPKQFNKKGCSEEFVSANNDIMPTVLDILDFQIEQPLSGKSLLQTEAKKSYQQGNYVISEDLYVRGYKITIRNRDYTFIYKTDFEGSTFKNFSQNNEAFELYNIKDDPDEKNNIFNGVSKDIRKNFFEILNNHINNSLRYHNISKEVKIGD